jgi:hypothetical protein
VNHKLSLDGTIFCFAKVEAVILSLLIAYYFHVLFVQKASVAQVKKFPAFYGKYNVHYRIQKRQQLYPILGLHTPHLQTLLF